MPGGEGDRAPRAMSHGPVERGLVGHDLGNLRQEFSVGTTLFPFLVVSIAPRAASQIAKCNIYSHLRGMSKACEGLGRGPVWQWDCARSIAGSGSNGGSLAESLRETERIPIGSRIGSTRMVCLASQNSLGEFYFAAIVGQRVSNPASYAPRSEELEREAKGGKRALVPGLCVLPV